MRKTKSYKYLSLFIALILILSVLPGAVIADSQSEVLYNQDFGNIESGAPSGWVIPKDSKYLNFNTYSGSPAGAPECVSGSAMNSYASGPGNRPAYVDIDSNIPQEQQEYIEFDFYMAGGVNTCNIFTLGNKQENSYTDLSNTFFALGNGDGIGERNALRFYDYNTDSWVSIPNASDKWLKIKIYTDFTNKQMAFDIKNGDGTNIGTYGPFSFASKFNESISPTLNRIIMSGFRSNGGSVSLNTWVDNFQISSMDTEGITFLNYKGTVPKGTLGNDYSFVNMENESVLKMINRSFIEDPCNDSNLLRVIDADIMITQLPDTGYQTIFTFNNDVNGNVMIDKNGNLVSQSSVGVYDKISGIEEKISINEWYNIKIYVFLTTSTDDAYYTFTVNGKFGDDIKTIYRSLKTRNSGSFKKLDLQIGGNPENTISSGYMLYKNITLEAKERPSISFSYDNTHGIVKTAGEKIENEKTIENAVPSLIRILPESGYDVNSIYIGNRNISGDISNDFIVGGYRYMVPLQDENIILNVTFNELQGSNFITTQEDEPYNIDPSQAWEIRKFACEARTLQIKNDKMAYRLYKPTGYDASSDKKYPLVVSLRARGDGNTGFNNEPYTAGHLEDILTSGENSVNFPCFILSPQCYDDNWSDNQYINISMVLNITDLLVDEFNNIDKNKIYIGGISDGANATWIATALRPDLFAAAFSMSGSALSTEFASLYTNTPIWTFYALDETDSRVVKTNQDMVNAIKSVGGDVITTEYETGGHIIAWKEGMTKSPLFQWMFSKEKGNTASNENINNIIFDYNNSLNTSLDIKYPINTEINNDDCTIQETQLGDVVTDAMREYTGADIALINSSDLGDAINSGQVVENDILNALPIKLNISTIELCGADILKCLTNSLGYYPEPDGRFLQISGMTINFKPELRPSQRIQSVLIGDTEINAEKIYKVAVTSHLVSNKLNNTYNEDIVAIQNYYQTVQQMLVGYLNNHEGNILDIQNNRINSIK